MVKKRLRNSGGDKPTRFQRKQARLKARKLFNFTQKAEKTYVRQLRGVGRDVGNIVRKLAPDGLVTPDNLSAINDSLENYAVLLEKWAEAASNRMQAEVGRYDYAAWESLGKQMGQAIGKEIRNAPTGRALRGYLAEQVQLITSLPRDAGKRVHKLTLQGLADSTRAAEIQREILQTGKVTEARAMLIARTEVARTASALTMARAQHIGSEGYIWRTSMDEQVRPSHRKMEGKYVRWDSPPTLIDGTTTHAGMIYNCRCWPEPILADEGMRR